MSAVACILLGPGAVPAAATGAGPAVDGFISQSCPAQVYWKDLPPPALLACPPTSVSFSTFVTAYMISRLSIKALILVL
jgi:hypothetical protein